MNISNSGGDSLNNTQRDISTEQKHGMSFIMGSMGSPKIQANIQTSPSVNSIGEAPMARTYNNTTLSASPPEQRVSEVNNYLHIIQRNIDSNDFALNKNRYGTNAKSRIDDNERLPK